MPCYENQTRDMEILAYFPTFHIPTLIILSISLVLLFRYFTNTGSYGHNLPPSPRKLPIIGNLHQVLGKNIHQTLWNVSRKYGPIMLLRLGSQPFVVISSSALASQALRTHDHALLNRPYSKTLKRMTYDYMDVAFSPHSDHWKHMRKVLVAEFLGSKRSRLYRKVLDMDLKTLLDSLSSDDDIAVELDEKITNLVTDVVFKVAVGKSYREETFRGTTTRKMLDEMLVVLSGSFSEIFPKFGWVLEDLSGWSRRLDKHIENFDGFLELILREHLDHTSDDEQDLIDDCRSRLTRDEMKSLLSNVFNGAIDTTSLTTIWAMSEIVKNPRVMQKLQSEIRISVGEKSSIDISDIRKMTYLKLVIKETLRIHSPPPFLLARECSSRIQIGGYDILPGTRVLINSWGIGRDPSVWTDSASEFYPERFEKFEVVHFEMIPFGGGVRSCPGYQLATATVEILIANLLHWFDWKLPSGMKTRDLDMEEEGSLLVARKTPLRLVPVKHNEQNRLNTVIN